MSPSGLALWPSRLQDAADIEALEEIRRLRRAE